MQYQVFERILNSVIRLTVVSLMYYCDNEILTMVTKVLNFCSQDYYDHDLMYLKVSIRKGFVEC